MIFSQDSYGFQFAKPEARNTDPDLGVMMQYRALGIKLRFAFAVLEFCSG